MRYNSLNYGNYILDFPKEKLYVVAKPIAFTDKEDLQGFVARVTEDGSVVYTDEAAAYQGMKHRSHWTVKHSANEYVKGMAHTPTRGSTG